MPSNSLGISSNNSSIDSSAFFFSSSFPSNKNSKLTLSPFANRDTASRLVGEVPLIQSLIVDDEQPASSAAAGLLG